MRVNLLRFSNVAPKVCAWIKLSGQHDFNHYPLAPLGIELYMIEPCLIESKDSNFESDDKEEEPQQKIIAWPAPNIVVSEE